MKRLFLSNVVAVLGAVLNLSSVPLVAADPPPPPANAQEAIAKIQALGGAVRTVAMNDDSLEVDFHLGGTKLTDEGLVNLKPLSKVVEVHLKDTQITDAGLANLAG